MWGSSEGGKEQAQPRGHMAEMEAKRRPLDKVKNMVGWSVGAVCELDFEILQEGDRIHSGEGKY